ncbi:TPA: hypothetical protein N0F65_001134 [Lagenidium giganteum]|uniref:Uncharacterized protein n=1 Tax=Lagenidium giganteum TaxID=4803 RepID=A0AAV2YXB1_9STRA|nr:TPA: hypothetical protein N0F65_001134 [Lagenidium giganteum]
MSKRAQLVAWIDWREWQLVHHELFADDVGAQQHALSRIAAWRSRGHLPIAVDATAQFVELALHERLAQHHTHAVGVSTRSHMELSLQYASAVVRCVNGLVDGSQKGVYAMAVSSLAQRIGIPLWIVDLRHESTHNQLPSLPVLRFAARHLLAWLRSNYWMPQETTLRSHVGQCADALLPRLRGTAGRDWTKTLDGDRVKNVVVPLLVHGEQYSERVAVDGLLFVSTGDEPLTDIAAYPKKLFTAVVLEAQALWRGASAWLLTHIVEKALGLCAVPSTDAPAHQAAAIAICLWWIKLLVGNEWRERLKFAAEPIEDVYQAGAELLHHCLVHATPCANEHTEQFDAIKTALRSCKGIRNHAVVAASTTLQKDLSKLSTEWTLLSAWPPSVLGHTSNYVALPSLAMDYPLEIDASADDAEVFTGVDDAFEPTDDEDAVIDAIMADIDRDYEQQLHDTVAVKAELLAEIVREGKSVHRKLLPQEEVQRIQNQIEIW